MAFEGFRGETFSFFQALALNNERAWFEAHKADYEELVVGPALALIAAIDPIVRSVSPHYRGVAKKIGGSLMRIYRDTRFARDKTPYKTNLGIQFRHENAMDVHAPGWYVHLDAQECFVGAGVWHPLPEELRSVRQFIAAHPGEYSAALEPSVTSTGMRSVGEVLQKVPRGFDADHPLAAEIRRKDFLISVNLKPELYQSPQLVDLLEAKIRGSAPYMAVLCRALGAPF